MASVNFLYRSTKSEANLVLRLLFRVIHKEYGELKVKGDKAFHQNFTDYSIGAKTKYFIEKDYWDNYHKKTRLKDIDLINKQVEVNTELNKIENHVLKAFNSVNLNEASKEWLQTQIDYYYNPATDEIKLSDKLTEYASYYLSYKKNRVA
jgi:hypothetical protein